MRLFHLPSKAYAKQHPVLTTLVMLGELLVVVSGIVVLFAMFMALHGCLAFTEAMPLNEESSTGEATVEAAARCVDQVPCRFDEGGGGSSAEASGSEGGESGESDGSSEGSVDEGESSSETSLEATESSSSDGGPGDAPYGPCGDCWPFEITASEGECACAPPCATDEDCPDGGSCEPAFGCVLPCDACLDGMQCASWQLGEGCFWP